MSVATATAVALLLVGCGTSTNPSASPTGTVTGRVTAGPTCPVERPGRPCPPAPVSATVQARTTGGRVIASAQTDAKGRYGMQLRVGTYMLAAITPHMLPRCPSVSVTVSAKHTTIGAIACDTGIR